MSKEAQTRGLVAPEVVLAGEFILAALLLRIAEIILGARLILLLVGVVVLVARLLYLAPAVRRCNTTQEQSSARCAKARKLHRDLYTAFAPFDDIEPCRWNRIQHLRLSISK